MGFIKSARLLGAKMPVIATPIASEGIVKNPLLYTVPLTVFEDELGNIWSKIVALKRRDSEPVDSFLCNNIC